MGEQLVEQFRNIGVIIENPDQYVTEKQKKDLLVYLENKYNKREKIVKNERWLTLKRKKITKINVKGKNTIVITKRNHTYVKSDPYINNLKNAEKTVENISSKTKKNLSERITSGSKKIAAEEIQLKKNSMQLNNSKKEVKKQEEKSNAKKINAESSISKKKIDKKRKEKDILKKENLENLKENPKKVFKGKSSVHKKRSTENKLDDNKKINSKNRTSTISLENRSSEKKFSRNAV